MAEISLPTGCQSLLYEARGIAIKYTRAHSVETLPWLPSLHSHSPVMTNKRSEIHSWRCPIPWVYADLMKPQNTGKEIRCGNNLLIQCLLACSLDEVSRELFSSPGS